MSDIVILLAQGPEHLPAFKPGGRLETFDIEELVAEGKAGYVHLSLWGQQHPLAGINILCAPSPVQALFFTPPYHFAAQR